MTAAEHHRAATVDFGHARPRLAPPEPLRSNAAALSDVARDCGIAFMPWQETASVYTEAVGPDGRHLFREVCEVVARQQGKTEKLVPLIVSRLRAGRRIMHTAQNRELPREVFGRVADIMSQDMTLFAERNGRTTRPRWANGQEEIRLANGGRYKIVAPTRGGARGGTNDDVIIDEVREFDTWDFIGAAKPTMTASPDPQILYYSNAGDDTSVVLNALRQRAGKDDNLAYLEWSAAPDRSADDRVGWMEANPAIGHIPSVLDYLEGEYLSNSLAGTLAIFETEHLCRWVPTMRQTLVNPALWSMGEAPSLSSGIKTFMGVSMDPSGTRASAALAWQQRDGSLALRMLYDVTGSPVDTQKLGTELRQVAIKRRVSKVGFDPLTDRELSKFFPTVEPVSGAKFANASSRFVFLVEGGKLRWQDCASVSDDLTWTARKEHDESGSFAAVRADDDRPITAALAAIRAVWLASGPTHARPRVY